MKKKNNVGLRILSLAILIFLTICIIYCSVQYKQNYIRDLEAHDKLVEMCDLKDPKISEEDCNSIIAVGRPVLPDTFTVFFQLLINSNLSLIQLFAPMVVILLTGYSFSREYNTGFFKNKLLRMSYKEYLKQIIYSAYKCIWILPTLILILFICSFIISGHFDVDLTLSYWPEYYIPIPTSILKNVFPFIIVFILNIILNSLFYANLSLISIKKSHNYIVSVIVSYLLFIFCDVILEILIGSLLLEKYAHLSQAANLFSLFNYWVYDTPSIFLYTIYCFLLAVVSLIFVVFVYRNKEGVIIESEK